MPALELSFGSRQLSGRVAATGPTPDIRYFPFTALGLSGNPFRRLTDDEWATATVLPSEIEAVLADDSPSRLHVQVIGRAGRGKSSTLVGMTARLRAQGRSARYEYLAEGQSALGIPSAELASLDWLLLDEAQRLGRDGRRRLFRDTPPGLRLALGTHEDLSALFAAGGQSLATVDLDDTRTDLTELTVILERRVAMFAVTEKAHPEFAPAALRFLHDRYGGDLRAMETLLYEAFQRLAALPAEPGSSSGTAEAAPPLTITENFLGEQAALTPPPASR